VKLLMNAGSLAEAIEAVVTPVADSHGLTVVDVDVRGSGRRQVVRVAVDRPGGVGIEECQRLSRELGDLLDVEDLVRGSYDLEVSSPGLDRELRKDREWRWATGRLVRLWTREPVDGRRELTGRLVGVEQTHVNLEGPESPVRVPRELVTKARLEVEPAGPAGSRRSR
jgi:ribosome maturation factor RimP